MSLERNPAITIVVVGVTLAVATSCFAESLADAWAIALSRNQRLQTMRTQTSAAEAELAAARSNRLPVFNVDSAFTQPARIVHESS